MKILDFLPKKSLYMHFLAEVKHQPFASHSRSYGRRDSAVPHTSVHAIPNVHAVPHTTTYYMEPPLASGEVFLILFRRKGRELVPIPLR